MSQLTSPAQPSRSRRSGSQQNPISLDDDDDDDVITDSSVGSSSPYFTQPTQILDRKTVGMRATQPTQILDRKTLGNEDIEVPRSSPSKPSPFKSSPGNIEVPRSSQPKSLPRRSSPLKPFSSTSSPLTSSPTKTTPLSSSPSKSPPLKSIPQGPPRPSRPSIFSLAPAGTSVRLPPARIEARRLKNDADSSDELSRAGPSKYHTLSDSSSSDHAQSDIQRTSFQRPLPSPKIDPFSARPHQADDEFRKNYDGRIQLKAMNLRKRLDRKFTNLQCAVAIVAERGDMDSAYQLLAEGSSSQGSSRSTKRPGSRSPSPQPKRRRLVRGRNPNNPPAPVIDLVDSEEDEESVSADKNDGQNYEADTESDADSDEAENAIEAKQIEKKPLAGPGPGLKRAAKILQYLQSCTVESLAVDAKISKDDARQVISKRPLYSISQVKAIHQFKTIRKKKQRFDLGEDVVEELVEYVKQIDAIDRVVEHCEKQGRRLNATVSDWRMDQLGNIKSATTTTAAMLPFPKEPKAMKGHCEMSPYQVYGMNWMFQLYSGSQFGGILADDMGLGKTCQAVAFISLLKDAYEDGIIEERPWPNLVVVPASVLENWENEFAKFAPSLSVATYSGSTQDRDALGSDMRDSPGDYQVILTTYSQMSRLADIKWMNRIKIHAAIFDEGHRLKNPDTKFYQLLIQIGAAWKLCITGTPIQNNIMELIGLLSFISPDIFRRDSKYFEQLFTQKASMKQVSEGAAILSDRIQRARSILEPFILQRKKEQVLKLPPKTRRVIFCKMDEDQAAQYEDFVARFQASKSGAAKKMMTASDGRKNDENNPWTQMRKLAAHPQLVRRWFNNERCTEMAKVLWETTDSGQDRLEYQIKELTDLNDFEAHLWCRDLPHLRKYDCPKGAWSKPAKVQELLKLVRDYQANGDRVLVFSRFKRILIILEECLAEEGIDYRVLTGETRVDERQALVDEFQEDKTIPVFLLTTGAGGQGLNLTGANKIIIFDQSPNPQEDRQAENRAHRYGQEKEVEVIRLISKGTIEELIYKACQKKLELAGKITGFEEEIGEAEVLATITQQLLGGGDEGSPSSATST